MSHTTRDVLRMAGHLLEDPKRQCINRQAANATGDWASPYAGDGACSWCVAGSLAASGAALKILSLSAADRKRAKVAWRRLLKRACLATGAQHPEDLVRMWNTGTKDERLTIAAKLRAA